MAKVMLSQRDGKLNFYVPKKDLEDVVVVIEFDSDEKFGGELTLANGQKWFIEPKEKKIPSEMNAKKISD
ncbi:MAG: putative nitrogen fixation protein NifT [Campylobacterales bacterium]